MLRPELPPRNEHCAAWPGHALKMGSDVAQAAHVFHTNV